MIAIQNCFIFLWNACVFFGSLFLTGLWLSFLFGSVLGVVLILIYAPGLFLLPMTLMSACIDYAEEPSAQVEASPKEADCKFKRY